MGCGSASGTVSVASMITSASPIGSPGAKCMHSCSEPFGPFTTCRIRSDPQTHPASRPAPSLIAYLGESDRRADPSTADARRHRLGLWRLVHLPVLSQQSGARRRVRPPARTLTNTPIEHAVAAHRPR